MMEIEAPNKDEQDAVNSLVRYLFSTLGRTHIPSTSDISIQQAVRQVIQRHSDKENAFNAIAYAVLHSLYAADRVLRRLYNDSTLKSMALDYLKKMGITFSTPIKT